MLERNNKGIVKQSNKYIVWLNITYGDDFLTAWKFWKDANILLEAEKTARIEGIYETQNAGWKLGACSKRRACTSGEKTIEESNLSQEKQRFYLMWT